MDVNFMRHYYTNVYENPQRKAVENSDTYFEKRNLRYEKEENFINKMKSIAPGLNAYFEEYLDSYSDELEILLEEMYILGASDREKMLKI